VSTFMQGALWLCAPRLAFYDTARRGALGGLGCGGRELHLLGALYHPGESLVLSDHSLPVPALQWR
jgi:hypothetical protein